MTSAVNPDEYEIAFKKINDENPDAIILHIGYSSKVSSTFQNSLIGSEGIRNVYHIDTLNVSGGLAIIVSKTIDLIEKNPSIEIEDLIKAVEKFSESVRFSFIPGNLDYLRAGGRVSNAQYLGANLLKLKPKIDVVSGELVSSKKYRGSATRVKKQMIKDFFTNYNIDKSDVYLINTNRLTDEVIEEIESYVKDLGVEKITWLKTGCVITSHSGPGGLGIVGSEK